MRLCILGASQGTGAECVRAALDRGHDVTAFARSPEKLRVENPRLRRLRGDFHVRDAVEGAVRGQDAVIITASSNLRGFKANPNYFSQGTGYAIDAMKAHGVRRLVVLSALGTGESLPLLNVFSRALLVSFLLKGPYEDHDRQEKLVRESGLDWIIARPGRLTNGPARKKYVKTPEIESIPSSISRADVADFMVTAAEVDTWVRKAVQLGG